MSQQSFPGALPPLKRKRHQGVGDGGQKKVQARQLLPWLRPYFHEVCHVIWHTTLIFSDRRSEETCPCKERTKADDIMDELEKEHKTMLDSKKDQLTEVEKEGESKDKDHNNN